MLQKYLKLEKANVASPCYRKYHLSLVKTFQCFDLSGLHISIEYSGSNQHFEVSETLTSFQKSRCLNFSEYSFRIFILRKNLFAEKFDHFQTHFPPRPEQKFSKNIRSWELWCLPQYQYWYCYYSLSYYHQ